MKLLSGLLILSFVSVAHASELPAELKSNNCMTCHQIGMKIVGPSFNDVAKKYATSKGGREQMIKSIRGGSINVWGPVPMPANSVDEETAARMTDWILRLK